MPSSSASNTFWLTVRLYWVTLLSMATIGVLVPAMTQVGHDLGVSAGELGLAISLFSLPSAVAAIAGGGLVDVIGARGTLLLSALAAMAADAIISHAGSLTMLSGGLTLAGVGFAGISVAAPAALMAEASGAVQARAMSFWSTYAPTGYAAGLLLVVPFLDGGHWRAAFLWHAGLMASGALLVALFPFRRSLTARSERGHWREGMSLLADPVLWRLSLAIALPNGLSYGVSLVAPSYLARSHGVGLELSSGAVAAAKIVAMLLGGIVTGHLLARRIPVHRLYLPLVGLGIVAQVFLFLPSTPFLLATFALIAWLFAFGGMAGAAMAHVPHILRNPARAGLASGFVGQMISIASFAAPPVYFGMTQWWAYVLVAVAGLVLSGWALPWRGRVA